MPPIPVFSNAPLKPQGITPQTQQADDAAGQPELQHPPPTPTTTTATHDQTSPPAPQPGARPVPPTANQAAPTSSSPPAPQPGAVASAHAAPTITELHTITSTQRLPSTPSQFSIPAPLANQAPTRSTQPDFVPQPSPFQQQDPSSLPERHSLEHPPGYVQDAYAGSASADRRASIVDAVDREREEDGVLGSVKGWIGRAGEGLKGVEQSAWRWAKGRG